jgi:hypothetical protein
MKSSVRILDMDYDSGFYHQTCGRIWDPVIPLGFKTDLDGLVLYTCVEAKVIV